MNQSQAAGPAVLNALAAANFTPASESDFEALRRFDGNGSIDFEFERLIPVIGFEGTVRQRVSASIDEDSHARFYISYGVALAILGWHATAADFKRRDVGQLGWPA